jgi:hypothetical protein
LIVFTSGDDRLVIVTVCMCLDNKYQLSLYSAQKFGNQLHRSDRERANSETLFVTVRTYCVIPYL